MNNHGWGLGTMLICIASVCICLIASAFLVKRLENITNTKISNTVANDIIDLNIPKKQ